MSEIQMIADTFDLQKRNKLCNIRGCERFPAKKVVLFEEDRITRERRNLATIYLCTEHNETRIPSFMTEVNRERRTGKVISKSVHETGLITY